MGKKFNKLRYHKPTKQWYVFIDGDREHLGVNEETARARYEAMRAAHDGELEPPDTSTVGALVKLYVEHLESKAADRRKWDRARPALDMLCAAFGTHPPKDLKAKAFRSMRERFAALKGRKTRLPVSRMWVNALADEIRFFVRWAAEEELMPAESAQSLLVVRPLRAGEGGRETAPVEPPEPGAVEATMEYLRRPLGEMVQLQIMTGCRPGEICAMTPAQLSRTPSEWLRVPGSARKVAAKEIDGVLLWLFVPASHKTAKKGKVRVVPIGPKGQALLAPLLAGRGPDECLFRPQDMRRSPRTRGSQCAPRAPRFSANAYGCYIDRAIEEANVGRIREDPPRALIPHWFPYQLRHLAATEVGDDFDADHAVALLGHTGRATLGVYMEQQLGKALKVAAERG